MRFLLRPSAFFPPAHSVFLPVVILKNLYEAFDSLAVTFCSTFDRLAATQKKEFEEKLSEIALEEEKQGALPSSHFHLSRLINLPPSTERERCAIETFLDNFRLAFEPFRDS